MILMKLVKASRHARLDRLGAVCQGVLRVGVHLDQQAVRAGGEGGLAHGRHQIGVARALGRIDHDR